MSMNFACSGCRGETMDHTCGRIPKSSLLPTNFSDFIRNASDKEKEETYNVVIDRAIKKQNGNQG